MNHPDVDYVMSLALPEPPARLESAELPSPPAFGSGLEAVAVGAQLAEFGDGVAPELRAVVSDCLLLAQLAADKAAAMNSDLLAWYQTYFEVLGKLGWLQTALEFQQTEVEDLDAGVHQALVPVLTSMLGPAVAATSVVVGVLKGLQAMDAQSPWITLVDRASSHARGAKLQLGFVDRDEAMVKLRMAAVALEAERRVTQVLFFKFKRERARMAVAQGDIGAPVVRLQGMAKAVAAKVQPFLLDNIGKIEV